MAPSTPERASAEASARAEGCRSYLAALDARASALSRLSEAFVPFLDAAGGGGGGSGGEAAAARGYREAAEAAAATLRASAPVAADLLASLRRAGLSSSSASPSSKGKGSGGGSNPSSAIAAVEAAEAAQREALRLTVLLHGIRKAATEGLKREGSSSAEASAAGGGHSCGHGCGHESHDDDGLQEARLRAEREEALAEATAALQEAVTAIGEARLEIAEAAEEFEAMV